MALSLIVASIFGMIAAGLAYAGPLFIKEIMNYIKKTNPTSGDERKAYMYASLWMVLYLLRIWIN
mgnify:CR=1 FL=1